MKKKSPNKTVQIVLGSALAIPVLLASGTWNVTAASPYETAKTTSVISKTAIQHPGPKDPREVEAFADNYFAASMKKFNVPGALFVVVKDGKVILQKGYGYADKEKKTPFDPHNTIVRVGSISKTITAAAVLQLVDQGKIDLHRDIQEYLGGIKIPNKTGKPVTMEHLLTHTSGFDFPYEKAEDASPDLLDKETTIKEFLVDRMPTVVIPPGEAYQYDDFAFALAGHAIENVTGMPFHQYMEEKFFKQLGMGSSSSLISLKNKANLATAYLPDGNPYPEYGIYPTDMPQGGMVSTGEDIAAFMNMLLVNGNWDGKQILSKKSVDLMNTYKIWAHPTIPNTSYGFESIYHDFANGQYVVGKGGNIPGFSSWVWLMPEQKVGAFVIVNNDSELRFDLYREFMDHYYPKDAETPKTYVPINKEAARRYVGYYKDLHMRPIITKITFQDDQLVTENVTGKHKLRMIDPLLFEDETGNKVAFKTDQDGSISYMFAPTSIDPISYLQKMPEQQPFVDIPDRSPYKPAIELLHSLEIMNGKKGTYFAPTNKMTRAEFVSMIMRAAGKAPSNSKSKFNDIEKSLERRDIQAAAELHLLDWVSGNRFEPNRPITREEAAVIYAKLKKSSKPIDYVRLSGKTESWAQIPVRQLLAEGIVDPHTKVNPDGSFDFRSKHALLRQDAAYLLVKILFHYL